MPKLVVNGVPPYDGEYEIAPITLGAARDIKRISGVRAGELNEALEAGDTDVLVAMAVITLQQNGFPQVTADELFETEAGKILIEESEADRSEDRPPELATSGGQQSESAAVAGPNDPSEPSGKTGTGTSESSPPTPLVTGGPGSVTAE